MNPTLMDTEIAQESRLVTEIPGPRSQGLLAKKTEAVSSGVGVGLPVFIERAGGGVLVDVDGNLLKDMGSGITYLTRSPKTHRSMPGNYVVQVVGHRPSSRRRILSRGFDTSIRSPDSALTAIASMTSKTCNPSEPERSGSCPTRTARTRSIAPSLRRSIGSLT